MHPITLRLFITALVCTTSLAGQASPFPWLQSVPLIVADTAHPPFGTRATPYRFDALLPAHRIVAFYGNPLSRRMGILGELDPEPMMARLDSVAATWQAADSQRTVLPALHLIVTVAQPEPGRDGMFRLRHGNRLIERVAGWAESRGWLLFLDIQPGRAELAGEILRLREWLLKPYVHLGVDPEFAMPEGQIPGQRIGTMDAEDVNSAIEILSEIVKEAALPPKILVVHRFTENMLTRQESILFDTAVQVVIDADGFGSPANKLKVYDHVVGRRPVQFAGLKLFYKNDKPMMSPESVVAIEPMPLYIQYQ